MRTAKRVISWDDFVKSVDSMFNANLPISVINAFIASHKLAPNKPSTGKKGK